MAAERARHILSSALAMRRVADDGVGLAVAERVSGLGLSKVDVAKYCEDACALMEAWEGYGNVILVDATQSGAMPGTVRSRLSCDAADQTRFRHIDPRLRRCMDACAVGSPSHRRETAGPAKRCKCSTTGGDHHRTPRHRYGSRSSPRAIVNLPGHAWGQLVAPGGHGHRPHLGGLQGARVRRPWYFRIEWC
jgi:hypothetical protein